MKIFCLSRAESPITHQLGTVGNESIVNTEDVRTPLGVVKVPVLSGNAIRHRMLRAPAADYLVNALELTGTLSRDVLNLLYHGGLKREKSKRPSLAGIAEMQRLFPMFRLLGACLPEAIVSGDLVAYRALLACRENMDRIEAMAPSGWCAGDGYLSPATSFVERWQYVRGKLTHATAHSAIDKADEDDSKMMPFAGTCVIPGSEWVHGFSVVNSTALDFGFIMHSLREWDRQGSSIGGQSSRGHGVLSLSWWCDHELDAEECIAMYEQHVAENADDCRKFLLGCYGNAA